MTSQPHRHFTVGAAGLATVVKLTDKSLGEETALSLAGELFGLAGRLGGAELHVDFDEVDYLGSTALGKLIALHKRVTLGGGRLRLIHLDTHLYEVFTLTRLDTFLDVRPKNAPGLPARVSA